MLALALGLVACGGDDDAGRSEEAGADGFRAAVDATCTENAVRVNRAADRFGLPTGLGDGSYETARAESSVEQAAAAAAIEPPSELAGRYADFVANLERYAELSTKRAEHAAARRRAAYEASAEELGALGSEQTALAAELGLRACARELSPESDRSLREVAVRVLTGATPERSCAEDMTPNFRSVNTGRGDDCVATLETLNEDGSEVEYLFSTGIDEVVASANVEIASAADARPKYVIYDFLWDDERAAWKIDSAFAPGGPAPAPDPDPGPSS